MFNQLKEEDDIQYTASENIEKNITSISKSLEILTDVLNGNNELLTKMNRNQSEISMAITDIRDVMVEDHSEKDHLDPDISKLLSAMIETADMIEAFFQFALQSQDQALIEQSEMMYKSMRKKYALAGLTKIAEEQTETDPKINTAVATDETAKEGIITKTLISGYVYKGNIIRKSEVIIGTRKEVEQPKPESKRKPKPKIPSKLSTIAKEEVIDKPYTRDYVFDVYTGKIIRKSDVVNEAGKEAE